MQQLPNKVPIALLAGRGELPHLLVDIFQSQNRPFVILAFKGQTEEDFVTNLPHTWLHMGEVGAASAYLKQNKIKEVVMAGAISRPALSDVRPDWEGIKWIARIGTKALGDDNLLKLIIGMVEEQGYRVVGADTILSDLLAPEGVLTALKPDEEAWRDIGRGVEVLSALSPVDVGQSIVVQGGLVLGIEAIEGTDALIERAGSLHRPGLGGILVKTTKRQQDVRADLPTIGTKTIQKVALAGLRGIAVEAERTLILNQKEVLNLAQQKDLFIVSLPSSQCHKSL
ncbi:MAG: UDP-2,3-diacylglucosamine diphosphatase LpxI [Alphaproteobacteria bacterium]|nr:UDP-2,3-diacylglucosamine diphosphatase LpxI [Alphaproteobacteria bacterium]